MPISQKASYETCSSTIYKCKFRYQLTFGSNSLQTLASKLSPSHLFHTQTLT